MIRVSSTVIKAPWLLLRPREKSPDPTPSKQRDAIDEAAASHRREATSRRIRDATEASFFMDGGRFL